MAAAAAYFAEDTHNHGRPVGRAGLLAVLDDIQTTFPDVQFKLIEAVAEGEWVVVRGIFSGTHLGIGRLTREWRHAGRGPAHGPLRSPPHHMFTSARRHNRGALCQPR
jgi:hypothetical protein